MTHDAHGCEAFLGPGFDLIFLAVGTVSRAYGRRNCAIAGLSSRLRKAGARMSRKSCDARLHHLRQLLKLSLGSGPGTSRKQ